ncbi:Subtilisin-like protease 2 [Hondaea fermentalgiana]|uniref:subtilisin n=1 Tax=Hondaea fermentalgiana TaxID=2315210 RepID=A0A2R5GNY4_9STRA|nr:Subtilisin-like protease 2 [Hondaea fermentalgiana]|eukprot:GBG29584.1 Subtilisin-like protease 2 [Hondaea fermentalgiana]
MRCALLLLASVASARGVFVSDAQIFAGSVPKWVAVVQRGVDCEAVRASVMEIVEEDSGDVTTSDMQVEALTSPVLRDCFIAFAGSLELAKRVVDEVPQVTGVDADAEVGLSATWNLDRLDQDALPLDGAAYQPAYSGAGVRIYVVDTGGNPEHQEFAGRLRLGADFVGESLARDMHGHGTHCASTAAGATLGVAPKAEVVSVKVLNANGSGSTSSVIRGIQWAVEDAGETAAVISLSLGGGYSTAMNAAVESASELHFVAVAAGNANKDACLVSPASAAGAVFTVGATDRNDRRSSFSNYGPCVDIFAPGTSVKGAWIPGSASTKTISGTSMATPQVAGLAAQALEKHSGDLDSARADVRATAVSGAISGLGAGSPDLFARAFEYTGPPTPPTPQPTLSPTHAEPELCAGDYCVPFAASLFGPPVEAGDVPLQVPVLAAAGANGSMAAGELCSATDQDFSGRAALVARGTCLFFEKVQQAEAQGAVAVLIQNEALESIFSPNYYGSGAVGIPSAMIGHSYGAMFTAADLFWGSPGMHGVTNSPTVSPSALPTASPVEFCEFLGKVACQRRSDCEWDRECREAGTESPTVSPTLAPTKSCAQLKNKKKCRRRPDCVWDRGCSDDVPAAPAPPTSAPTKSCVQLKSRKKCRRRPECEWNRGCLDVATTGPTTASPTAAPTAAPTPKACDALKNKKKCKRRSDCVWDKGCAAL